MGDALPEARVGGGDAERFVLHAMGWAPRLSGDATSPASQSSSTPRRTGHGRCLFLRPIDGDPVHLEGRGHWARTMLARLIAVADERGEALSSMTLSLHLCELSLRSGQWRDADRFLAGWEASTDYDVFPKPVYERCRALLAAGRGLTNEAEVWAADAIAHSEAVGLRWDGLEAMRARGLAALAARKPAGAGYGPPRRLGTYPNGGGRRSRRVPGRSRPRRSPRRMRYDRRSARGTERLEQLANEQDHSWARVGTARCKALLLGGEPTSAGDIEQLLTQVADAYGDLGLRFDRARSLLILGRKQRRLRRWAAARLAFEHAATAFSEIGSQGSALALGDIDRLSARRPQPAGRLTPSEQRVARLAAHGHANKEIAKSW